MNEQKNNGRGIFYGVIGVATLVVAIIGATFAYFTATASNNIITGNMATVKLSLAVEKVTQVDESKGGMIPMSNGMVEAAVNNPKNEVCVDDNGNAVCQVYQITLTNDSTAGQFVDGYVALRGGSGIPQDFKTYEGGAKVGVDLTAGATAKDGTTMRWAQVFKNVSYKTAAGATCEKGTEGCLEIVDYSTAGDQILGAATEKVTLTALGNQNSGHDVDNIRTNNTLMAGEITDDKGDSNPENDEKSNDAKGILKSVAISGTKYNVIGTNYIRVSNHIWKTTGELETYDRTADATSALVFNHSIAANRGTGVYYIVVWLSETGTNQTPSATVGSGDAAVTNPGAENFFRGNVTFVSAQGSEVSATFSGYARVPAERTA